MTDFALVEEADRATAAGDIARATAGLRRAVASGCDDPTVWLKIAALERASGRSREALGAVDCALLIAPLDFMALLLRAILLENLGDKGSAEAFENALARRPNEPLSPQVAPIVVHGEQRVAEWRDARETRLLRAAASTLCADAEELVRINRFASNVVRRARVFHSEPTVYHFPGLVEREFHPPRLFPWLTLLEVETDMIAAELAAVMAAERNELVPYIQYASHLPLELWRPLNNSLDWTAIHLLRNGELVNANARHTPRTLNLLAAIGQPVIPGASPNAMFSLLAPHTQIPPHVGINNSRLVCHLPLVVPPGCWFRVGAETREWRRGEAFVFDDTIEHEAANPSDDLRVVLIFDVWHPDLSPAEREAVAAMIGSDGSAGSL